MTYEDAWSNVHARKTHALSLAARACKSTFLFSLTAALVTTLHLDESHDWAESEYCNETLECLVVL